jgi:hypothetical protein
LLPCRSAVSSLSTTLRTLATLVRPRRTFIRRSRWETSQTSIGTGDSEGVALAAIQGLHQLVQERDARIGLLESRIQAQQQELDELRQTVKAMQSRITAGM